MQKKVRKIPDLKNPFKIYRLKKGVRKYLQIRKRGVRKHVANRHYIF